MRTAILITIAILTAAGGARAVKIADITRLDGQRANVISGLGLVVGLGGTGDGGDFLPAIRPLATMLGKLRDETSIKELGNASNVALVQVTATIPPTGVRSGDKIDVYVASVGAAKSLRGGRLVLTPLTGPMPQKPEDAIVIAMAEGPVTLEDRTSLTSGVIKDGALVEEDIPAQVISNGRIRLIIETPSASWTMASTIAKMINDAEGMGETLAVAVDEKNVEVVIPANERERPDSFISRVQRLPVPMLPTEARVQINEKTGTIIMTGDVEISPVVISHKGLTISTIRPEPVPTPRTPVVTEKNVISLDTTRQGGANLQELVEALDMIKVPAEDRIAIVKELHKTGKLHAKLELR